MSRTTNTVLPRPATNQIRKALVAGALLLGAGTSVAQPPRPPIDVATLEARAAEAFAKADADGDGMITEQEFSAVERPARSNRGPGGHKSHRSNRQNPDTSARQNRAEEMFDLLDSNGDDSLSRDEFSRANQQAVRQTLGHQRAFSRLDANDDGVLTIEEFPPSRLAARDTNGDGTITQEELNSGRSDRNTNGG
jgi:Ca2+-binding EF-hand superfamily protein